MPVAIEFETLPDPYVEVGDTLRLHVRVLDRGGDSLPGVAVRLVVLDTGFLGVDSADFAVIGRADTAGARVVAIAGALRSDPLTIRVPPGHADSLAPASAAVDTLAASDTVSALLKVKVLDLTTTPGTAAPLLDRDVRFTVVAPVFGRPDTAAVRFANDSLGQTVRTGGSDSTATVALRRTSGVPPDSVVVQAAATRSSGAALAGSPVRFVIRFQ